MRTESVQLHPLRLVTVVGESIVMPDIAEKGLDLGASGYTLSEVLGRGSRNARSVILNGECNTIKCEFVVDEHVATKILAHVSENYFDNYACIAWVSDVAVLSPEHSIARTAAAGPMPSPRISSHSGPRPA